MLKRYFKASCLALLFCSFMILTACSTISAGTTGTNGTGDTPPSKQNLTPQQVVAIVCPPLQSAMEQLQGIYATQAALGSPSAAKVVGALAKASPIVASACTVGASVDITTVQAFVSTALPALAQVAGTLPLTSKQLQDVQTLLLTAQVALGVYNVVQAEIASAQGSSAGPAPASTVTPKP